MLYMFNRVAENKSRFEVPNYKDPSTYDHFYLAIKIIIKNEIQEKYSFLEMTTDALSSSAFHGGISGPKFTYR